ncbi:hypothetical protein H5410_030813 [Solanum commersonii]|uniref:Uncharacterized protein n=1 Tax=Solanum commersonii TaxID=4109 RepID=A0A9J5YFC3_SOLCO|nr:hypothetical protein H5410_030813 [Solanum commersonii]
MFLTISRKYSMPWMVGGDFNVILRDEEKIGGLPNYPHEYEDFAIHIHSCDLFDINFQEILLPSGTIGIVVNQSCFDLYGNIGVQHLARTGSDHAKLFLSCGKRTRKSLCKWSRDKFGDIFKQIAIIEEIVKIKEVLFQKDPSFDNRSILSQAHTELKLYVH